MSSANRAERRRQERAAAKRAPGLAYEPSEYPTTPWMRRQKPEIRRVFEFEPAVKFTLYGPADQCTSVGTLDSGAHGTAIPQEWAERLGCDLSRAERMKAWGNGVLADYFYPAEPLRLEIAGRVIDLVAPSFGPWHSVLLGRADVFRHFRVTIDERAQRLFLDPYDSE